MSTARNEICCAVSFALSSLSLSVSRSLSVATADQMCKQRINFESQDTVWQTHMHTSTQAHIQTRTGTNTHTHSAAHALPNIFVNKLLHTFRQLLQLHLDAVLRLPQHSFPRPCTCRYSFLTSLSPSFLPSTLNSICLCYANALTGFPNPKSICVALIVSLFLPLSLIVCQIVGKFIGI